VQWTAKIDEKESIDCPNDAKKGINDTEAGIETRENHITGIEAGRWIREYRRKCEIRAGRTTLPEKESINT
jgi:hypothetical protein